MKVILKKPKRVRAFPAITMNKFKWLSMRAARLSPVGSRVATALQNDHQNIRSYHAAVPIGEGNAVTPRQIAITYGIGAESTWGMKLRQAVKDGKIKRRQSPKTTI